MSHHFIVPTFNKSTPDKIHNSLVVTGQNTVSHPTEKGWISAIATESIPATVDGEYIFLVRIDNIGQTARILIGVTPMETFDASKESYPGNNGMTGSALYLYTGTYRPGSNQTLIDATVCKKSKEVIVAVTIANSGAQKLVRWIVNGVSSANLDCTADCTGDKLFPLVSLCIQNQQFTTIPINDQEVKTLIGNFLQQYSSSSANQGAAAVASHNQQQLSSAAFAQLQQELEKERKRADTAEQIIVQQNADITRMRQFLNPSPFVKDKLYQIDFAVNGITPPADPNAFGTLLKLPSQNNSVLFQHVKNELWKKLGTSWPSPAPVNHFTLESVEVLHQSYAGFEDRIRRLQLLRTQNGNFFNPPTGAFTAEQLQTLIALRDQFLPRSSNADPKSPNLINVFHGTKVDRLQSVVNGLVAVRSTDAGYFGSGVYTTTSIEYAAKYAKGDFDFKFGPYPPRASDGCVPVVWCVAAVGVCYPLTKEVDYSKKRVHDGMGVSDFFGAPLTPGYDCHCVAVNESVGFQAVPRKEMQYMEVVFDQEVQVLPIAVLWVKSM